MTDMSKKDLVWSKAKPMRGADKMQYRQDPYGDKIRYSSHGKDTPQGWEIDHIKPKSRGGSDNVRNLQALQWQTNRAKGDGMLKKSRHSKLNK